MVFVNVKTLLQPIQGNLLFAIFEVILLFSYALPLDIVQFFQIPVNTQNMSKTKV